MKQKVSNFNIKTQKDFYSLNIISKIKLQLIYSFVAIFFVYNLNSQSFQHQNKDVVIDSLLHQFESSINKNDYLIADSILNLINLKFKVEKDFNWSELLQFRKNLGRYFYLQGNYKNAHNEWIWIKSELQNKKDTITELYSYILNGLGLVYDNLEMHDYSEDLHLQNLKLRTILYGEHSKEYAQTLANLGQLYYFSGNFKKSEHYYLRALNLREKNLGTAHEHYASTLNNLANLYMDIGRFDLSQLYFMKADSILINKDSKLEYLTNLSNIANLETQLGYVQQAEEKLLRIIQYYESNHYINYIDYVNALISIGYLYDDLGQHSMAQKNHLKAIEILEVHEDYISSTYVSVMLNLSHSFFSEKNYIKSINTYQKLLNYFEEGKLENQLFLAKTLSNMGLVYSALKDYHKADELFNASLSIRKTLFEGNELSYANFLINIGFHNYSSGNYDLAFKYTTEAIDILRNHYVADNINLLKPYFNLALICYAQNNHFEASNLFITYLQSIKKYVINACKFMNTQELSQYLEDPIQSLNYIYSIIKELDNDHLNSSLFDISLFYKSRILTHHKSIKIQDHDAVSKEYALKLEGLYRTLNVLYNNSEEYQDEIVEVEKEILDLEKKLALTTHYVTNTVISWKDIQQQLSPEDIAVDFIKYLDLKMDSIYWRYLALVVTNDSKSPIYVELFDEMEIIRLTKLDVSQIYEPNINFNETLYSLIWDKIFNKISSVPQTIYVSNSGILNRINHGAIKTNSGQIMSELHSFRQSSNLTEIVSKNSIVYEQENTSALFYDIAYDNIIIDDTSFNNNVFSSLNLDDLVIFRKIYGDKWSTLKHTIEEGLLIKSLMEENYFDVKAYTRHDAKEDLIKFWGEIDIKSPNIIHIATHGFYFDQNISSNFFMKQKKLFSFDPLFKSGLIFSGANFTWLNGYLPEGAEEDGILTAYEVSQLDLRNTQLVVLSACETGLGDLHNTEGVYGLQRAFKLAGAKYLIMSLWQVPDMQTKVFMTTFYTHWLEHNMTIPEAFRKTQLEMKALFDDPLLWAGFILLE